MRLEDIAGWIAPIATMIAACVTAANLGSRITGWGFVIFTVGSLAWTTYGFITGQSNLAWQSVALTAINIVGIWRWLGRQARFDEGAMAAAHKSERRPGPTMFPVSMLGTSHIAGPNGESVGSSIDAMANCTDGRIEYLVMSTGGVGGVGETLHVLPWDKVNASPEGLTTNLTRDQARSLARIEPDDWPGAPPAPSRA